MPDSKEEDIDRLISKNCLAQDAENFDIADKLLAEGVALPKERRQRNSFANISEYLHHLAFNVRDLYIALRSDPEIINKQDELGKTILHCVAELGLRMGSNSGSLILYLLFNADPKANFSIKDNDGNTPVHIAAALCNDLVTCRFVFPNFVQHAAEDGFNFSILNNEGHAVIHLAALLGYVGYPLRYNTITELLSNSFQIDIDVLSSAGCTAFFYAINNNRLVEAHTLLDAGADPLLFGNSDGDPLKMVDEFITGATEDLFKCMALIKKIKQKTNEEKKPEIKSVLELESKQKNLANFIAEYESLKIKMLRIAEKKQSAKKQQQNTASVDKAAVASASVNALVAMTNGSTTVLAKDSNSGVMNGTKQDTEHTVAPTPLSNAKKFKL